MSDRNSFYWHLLSYLGICGDRIFGHVTDSAVEAVLAPKGISTSITNSKILQNIFQKSLETYIDMFPVTVKSYLMDSNRLYLENPLKLPTHRYIYIYSRNDKVAKPEAILNSFASQKKRNVPSFIYEFDTPHVQHFRKNPEKYAKLLDDFIDFIKIRNFSHSSDDSQQMMFRFQPTI